MKIPQLVKAHIKNVRYFLNTLQNLPSPVAQGVRILLLLTAWENMHIAIEELRARIWETPLPPRLHKSHEAKLKDVRGPITRIYKAGGGKLLEKAYTSPKELSDLLQTARYGPKGASTTLEEYFGNHTHTQWHTDEFERNLLSTLSWLELEIEMLENLDKPQSLDMQDDSPNPQKRGGAAK
jgi:hypothetical protein